EQPRNALHGESPNIDPDQLWLTDRQINQPQTDSANDPDLTRNLTAAATRLSSRLAATLSLTLLTQRVAETFAVSPAAANQLLTTAYQLGTAKQTALLVLTDPSFVSSTGVDQNTAPEAFQAYWWLDRLALVLKTLKMTDADLQWVADFGAKAGVL